MLTDKFANTALCQHARLNNQPCGQPALRGRKFCRFHETARLKAADYSIPMVEDAVSLQLAIMQVIRALHDHAMDSKTASLTLYALQIASGNLKRFAAEQSPASDDPAREASLLESLVKLLGLPETPEELMAEMRAQSDLLRVTLCLHRRGPRLVLLQLQKALRVNNDSFPRSRGPHL